MTIAVDRPILEATGIKAGKTAFDFDCPRANVVTEPKSPILDLQKAREQLGGAREQLSQVDKSLAKVHTMAEAGRARVDKAEEVRQAAQEALQKSAALLARQSPAEQVLSYSQDFDRQWKAFQKKFDDLLALGVSKLSGQSAVKPSRPAEVISESRAAQVLARAQRLVVLTGAGISAESGIPTFRGSDGFWTVGSQNYTPQEMATWEMYNKQPEQHWRWCQYRFGMCRTAKPNGGHRALVEMEKLVNGGHGFKLVTQNIDSLHLQAGSNPENLCEIHGRLYHMRCDERIPGSCLHGVDFENPYNFAKAEAAIAKTPVPNKVESKEQLPVCKTCGTRMRPKILWFDESYNEALFRSKTARQAAEQCDVMLIIGTQLTTGMPSRMVQCARSAGAVIIKLDPEVELNEPRFDGMLHLPGASGDVLPRLVQMIKELQQEPELAPLAVGASAPVPTAPAASTPSARASLRTSSTPALRRSTIAGSGAAAVTALTGRSNRRSETAKSRSSSTAAIRAAAESSLRPASKSGSSTKSAASTKSDQPPVGYFVYDSLRPDTSSATPTFLSGWASTAATLPGASLYNRAGQVSLCLEQTRCAVRGVLLTPMAKDKLAESLPHMAELQQQSERSEVTVYTTAGHRKAYVYHATGKFERQVVERLLDGDWLSRSHQKSEPEQKAGDAEKSHP